MRFEIGMSWFGQCQYCMILLERKSNTWFSPKFKCSSVNTMRNRIPGMSIWLNTSPQQALGCLLKVERILTTRQGSWLVHELSPNPMSLLLLSTWILRLFLLYDFWLYSSSAWEYLIAVPVPFGLCLGSESPFFGLWMDFLIKSMGVERVASALDYLIVCSLRV